MYVDYFTFLNLGIGLSFGCGTIEPVPDFDKVSKEIMGSAYEGYLFPPNYHVVRIDPLTGKETERSKTGRPAEIFGIPASHCLTLYECHGDQLSNRMGLAGFVVQSMAYLLGLKLQFHDWWLVGRIPAGNRTVNIFITRANIEIFLRKAIDGWKQFDVEDRRRITNLLYVFSEAGTREWDWEHFQLEYMVTDACFKIADNHHRLTKNRRRRIAHDERMQVLADVYGLRQNEKWFGIFRRLRNDLFHECLWDGGQVFTAPTSESGYAPFNLRRFNHRLIMALLGITTPYVGTDWTAMGSYPIDITS